MAVAGKGREEGRQAMKRSGMKVKRVWFGKNKKRRCGGKGQGREIQDRDCEKGR